MTTTESTIKPENLLNIVNTRDSRQESIARDEERQSRIENLSDQLKSFSNNTQILGTLKYTGPSVVVEDIGVSNTEDTVAPILNEQSKEQLILTSEESEVTGRQEETDKNICPDECTCKVIRALYLVVDQMKKVDSVINKVKRQNMYVYIPTAEDKNAFINSIKENSQVCHVIINELKKQRIQINEMLKLYNQSTVKFSRLDAAMDQESRKIGEMEVEVARVSETVENLEKERAERHVLFLEERTERKVKDEKDEELYEMDMAWLSTLEERRMRQLKEDEERDKEQELKRIKDRAMLTAAIRQLQELTVAQRTLGVRRENLTTFGKNPANEINCKNRRHFHSSDCNKSIIPIPPRTIPHCHCSGLSPVGLKKINTTDPIFVPIAHGLPVKMLRTHLNKTSGDKHLTFKEKTVEDHMQANGTCATGQDYYQQKKLQLCHMTHRPIKLGTNTPLTVDEPTGVVVRSQQGPVKRMYDELLKKGKHCKNIKTINKNQNNIGIVRPWFRRNRKNYV